MNSESALVLKVSWKDRSWQPTGAQGLSYSVLRPHDGGASIYLKFEKGVVGANHIHPEGEELLVISGDITIGGKRLGPGDYLYTPPGAAHEAVAHEETVLFLNFPKAAVDPRQLDLPGPTIRFAGCGRPDGGAKKWSQAVRLHGEGRAGRGVAEKTDGRQDAGGVSGSSRNE